MSTPEQLAFAAALAELLATNQGAPGKSAYELAVDGGYVGTLAEWQLSNKGAKGDVGPAGIGASIPGGRLTLASGYPEMMGGLDYINNVLYYAPYNSNRFPWFNSTEWEAPSFTASATDAIGAMMIGGAAWAPNTNRDAFLTPVNGAIRLVTGPAWPSTSMSSRGLMRHSGLWVNGGQMLMDVSETEQVLVPMYRATAVGSISIGADAGVLKALFALGKKRACEVWNFYNQRLVSLGVLCKPPAGQEIILYNPANQYSTDGFLPFNLDYDLYAEPFTGLPQQVVSEYLQRAFLDSYNKGLCAVITMICKNSMTNKKGTPGSFSTDLANLAIGVSSMAKFRDPDAVGRHKLYMTAANANDIGTIGATLWSAVTQSGRALEDPQILTAEYMG